MTKLAPGMPAQIAPVTAVVLAGGDRGDLLAGEAGVPAKALLPIDGRPMGAYVLHALRDCAAVRRIVYVGPTDSQLDGLYDVALPAGERLVDSLALGVGAALGSGASDLLVLSADIPWLDGAMITRFLASCATTGPADIYYPVVREESSRARFPDQQRTFVKLRDGRFTGANLALASQSGVTSLLPLLDSVYRARKNPFALAAIMGPAVLVRLLLGVASIASLENRAARLLGLTARAVISADPELAADVDRPTHLPGVLDPEQPSLPHRSPLVPAAGDDR